MRELSFNEMEELYGGAVNVPACASTIISGVAAGVLIATTPATGGSIWLVAGYMFGGFATGVGIGGSAYDCVSSFF